MNDDCNIKTIEIIEDSSFSFEGYQVVRGEFFAHVYEPSITLNNYKVSLNTACIKKLPEVDYVQILVNPETKKLAVRPCSEEVKDSVRWCTGKRSPKQITCRVFFAKVVSLMGWTTHYRYKIIGKLIKAGDELLFVFDLNTPEIFPRTIKEDGTTKTARTPSYPAVWQNQFGLSVEEHQKNIQVNIFKGYAVFSLESSDANNDKKSKATALEIERTEESTYEQLTLQSDTGAASLIVDRPEKEPNSYP